MRDTPRLASSSSSSSSSSREVRYDTNTARVVRIGTHPRPRACVDGDRRIVIEA